MTTATKAPPTIRTAEECMAWVVAEGGSVRWKNGRAGVAVPNHCNEIYKHFKKQDTDSIRVIIRRWAEGDIQKLPEEERSTKEITVPWCEEGPIWICPHEMTAGDIMKEKGVSRGRIWTVAEINFVKEWKAAHIERYGDSPLTIEAFKEKAAHTGRTKIHFKGTIWKTIPIEEGEK